MSGYTERLRSIQGGCLDNIRSQRFQVVYALSILGASRGRALLALVAGHLPQQATKDRAGYL
jgi:hypothetical protein